jgi:hypothetical protein
MHATNRLNGIPLRPGRSQATLSPAVVEIAARRWKQGAEIATLAGKIGCTWRELAHAFLRAGHRSDRRPKRATMIR